MNYLLNIATTILAAFGLAKDWTAHKSWWRRATVGTLVLLLGGVSLANTYRTNKKAAVAEVEHQQDISTVSGLKAAIETANKAQAENTRQFLEQFNSLSTKLGDLETQAKTAGLQSEADQLRRELAATRAALSPPLATLNASVANVGGEEDLTRKTLAHVPNADHVATFIVLINNSSKVQARNGSIGIRLCVDCSYATEPLAFERPPGAAARDRELKFRDLAADESISITLLVKLPPSTTSGFSIGVLTRCENCQADDPQELKLFLR